MEQSQLNWITGYLWGIADDVLRRLDAVLEDSKMTAVMKDDTELFKQFMDNEGFKRWMTDTIFGLTYVRRGA